MEPDFSCYEVWKKIGSNGNWILRTTTTNNYHIDYSEEIYKGNLDHWPEDLFYKIRSKDNTSKYSLFTDEIGFVRDSEDLYPSIKQNDLITININHKILDKVILYDNYPNPFNPSTFIKFSIPERSYVELIIYSITGQKIITLVDNYLNKGIYEVRWNGMDYSGKKVSSGIYIYIN